MNLFTSAVIRYGDDWRQAGLHRDSLELHAYWAGVLLAAVGRHDEVIMRALVERSELMKDMR